MMDATCKYRLPQIPLPVVRTVERAADGSLAVNPTNIDKELIWSNLKEPPAIGQAVRITFNELGTGTVASYFTEHGWLGVIVKLDKPPKWHVQQTERDKSEYKGHALVFGIELEY